MEAALTSRRTRYTVQELPSLPSLPGHLEQCSVKMYSAKNRKTVLRIPGRYASTTNAKNLTLARLQLISAPTEDGRTRDALPRILARDPNFTKWGDVNAEWMQEAGAIEWMQEAGYDWTHLRSRYIH